VAVADAFDVMTSARSYKRPRSAAAGREELLRCSGTQFDPAVVRAFLSVSVGRLRTVIGPLSWLAQLPVLSRVPLGATAINAVSAAVVTPALALGSLLGAGPTTTPPPRAAQSSAARILTDGEAPGPVYRGGTPARRRPDDHATGRRASGRTATGTADAESHDTTDHRHPRGRHPGGR
jgi:hypothetical protein